MGEIRDSFVAGLAGGVVLAIVLYTAGSHEVISAASGLTTTAFIGSILVITPLLGFVFGAVVSKSVNRYIDVVLTLTTSSEAAKNLIKPLTDRFGMAAVTIVGMGLLYGVIIGVLAFLVVPLVGGQDFPFVNWSMLGGMALYGLVLGGIYGYRFTV
jgi:hypothetical protein